MERYISADRLIKCVKKWLPSDPCGREEKEFPFETDICVSMLMEIEEQPTADVIEVRHGKWIPHKSKFGGDDEPVYTCSECGDNVGFRKRNFCPECGTKMDGVKHDSD